MTTSLVQKAPNGELTTTSEIIAEGVGIQHKNILETIRKNQTDFEEFGRVAFETRTFDTAGGSQQRTIAILNREQAMLLMIYMRNNPIVRGFKKNLIKAFVTLERQLEQSEHKINTLILQARSQMELCQAAKGLIRDEHLEAKARIILARGLGEAPEIDPATRPLYTADFLKEKNLSTKRMKSVAGVFGKRMKAAYTLEHGQEPGKYDLTLPNGQIRQVNAYTEADRPLMQQVWDTYYAA
ncbi:Rha family transcriptional regulator [Corynebacterium kutscheri]|uniref:Rha family transcriptional regulator n=1 Tax=Corynebacterium kutscheri TaxID=35755 RepID=UPI0037C0157C